MIRPTSVLRDLARGEPVRRVWAPEAVDELVAQGVVVVVRGVVRLAPGRRIRKGRAVNARGWRRRIIEARLAAGPALTCELAQLARCTTENARVICRRLGADATPVRLPRNATGALWALPQGAK